MAFSIVCILSEPNTCIKHDMRTFLQNFKAQISTYTGSQYSLGVWERNLIFKGLLKVKVAWSSLTLCDPMDHTVHGILQARILEWIAFPFSRDLPNPGTEPRSSHIAGRFFTSWATRKTLKEYWHGLTGGEVFVYSHLQSEQSLLLHHAFFFSLILKGDE